MMYMNFNIYGLESFVLPVYLSKLYRFIVTTSKNEWKKIKTK